MVEIKTVWWVGIKMEKLKFNVIAVDGGLFVFSKDGDFWSIGVAEATRIDESRKNVYYFNRLFIHKPYRGKGYSKQLLEKFVEECDKHEIDIELNINSYGELSFEKLKEIYERYGFKEITENYFIRKHINEREHTISKRV